MITTKKIWLYTKKYRAILIFDVCFTIGFIQWRKLPRQGSKALNPHFYVVGMVEPSSLGVGLA